MFLAWDVVKARNIFKTIKRIFLTTLTTNSAYDITLSIFFHVSKVATLIQVKAIYSQPYCHMCISDSQLVRNNSIAVFDGIAVFARLRCLNVITSIYIYITNGHASIHLSTEGSLCYPFSKLCS